MPDQNLGYVRERLDQAERVVALTGAGISAESGVPTFRGEGGLWEKHRPEELATPQAFAKDPELVWRWYHWRRGLIAECEPNSAHLALAGLEERLPHFTLITQNVDGLHKRAGSRNVLEIHGSIWRLTCQSCSYSSEERSLDLPAIPTCPHCGHMLRPGVVWFGESLDSELLASAWHAAENCQVMLVVGTSAVVQPAAGLALVAKRAGAFVVEANLEATPNTGQLDVTLLGKAGELLPSMMD